MTCSECVCVWLSHAHIYIYMCVCVCVCVFIHIHGTSFYVSIIIKELNTVKSSFYQCLPIKLYESSVLIKII